MSDSEFDRLLVELRNLEAKHPELADPESPSARVGSGSTTGFAKVKHTVRCLSLDNAFNIIDVHDFFRNSRTIRQNSDPAAKDYIVEPKVDGLSLCLRYDHGNLVQAITRGDGTTGDDVTANAMVIPTIPHTIPGGLTIEVRGEAFMYKSGFEKINTERVAAGEEPFANPRNAASGTMKQKDTSEVAKRPMGFIGYRLIGTRHPTQLQCLGALKDFGFVTPIDLGDLKRRNLTSVCSFAELEDAIMQMDADRKKVDFDTDGAVIKFNSMAMQDELGDGTKYVKWGLAYKYPAEKRATRLNSITVSIGRLGTLTPIAELEPVQLGGSTVKRASLCNQDEIDRLGLDVGDEVIVEKAGEIIPKVVGVVSHRGAKVWKMPKKCPCCDTEVVRAEGAVAYRCPNFMCSDQVFERLKHAVQKGALDIDGCGDSMIQLLMANGVKTLSDLLSLRQSFLPVSAATKKFFVEREKARQQPLWRKLAALGIDGVGQTLSKELAARYNSLDKILDLSRADLVAIMGPVSAGSFLEHLRANADEIGKLDELGFKFEDAERAVGPLTGKVFVITGGLMSGSRGQVSKKIEDAGGIVKSSVGKKVDYLVAGDGGGNTKAVAAQKLGTKVITEEELYVLLGQPLTVSATATEEREY